MRGKKVVYHILSVLLLSGLICLCAFVFTGSTPRIGTAFRDFGTSCAYYFAFCVDFLGFKIDVEPTVIQSLPSAVAPIIPMPVDVSGAVKAVSDFFPRLLSADNFNDYFMSLSGVLRNLIYVLLLLMPLIVLLIVLFRLKRTNNDYDKDSKPLSIFRALGRIFYSPSKQFVLGYIDFIKANRYYFVLGLFAVMYALNLLSVLITAFSWLLYFVVSFDFSSLYGQIVKLLVDLCPAFDFFPKPLLILFFAVFVCFRLRDMAFRRLRYYESANRNFINNLPLVSMVVGTMGSRKTTLLTDMALSQDILFRDKAYELLLENDLKFPNFPWINFELDLKFEIENHTVYSLATCRSFVEERYRRFDVDPHCKNLWNYDYIKYGLSYDDGLRVLNLLEVLTSYAQLYFIYIFQSSLLVSNFGIREDYILLDQGNFPIYNSDFFRKDSRLSAAHSRHSHILDFDMLRLGRRVVEFSLNSGVLEFGVILITEIGKERGNKYDHEGMKRADRDANKVNDLFNLSLKMCRHFGATVDNFPFIKIFTDDQRPESLGADARELADIVYIDNVSDKKISVRFFAFMELLYDFIFSRFVGRYQDYRFRRGDNTLFMYCFKGAAGRFIRLYNKLYNLFGYRNVVLKFEPGTFKGKVKECKYYLMNKKVYSNRFSTDCFSGFFANRSLNQKIGLDDFSTYQAVKPTFAELQKQHSYFISDLKNNLLELDYEE
jgi:hypothetical protein